MDTRLSRPLTSWAVNAALILFGTPCTASPQANTRLLAEQLTSSNWGTRVDAAKELRSSKEPQAGEALMRALADSDYRVRGMAAQSLGELRHSAAASLLIHRLSDAEEYVVDEAAVALGKTGSLEAFEPLSKLLATGTRRARWAAAQGLGALKDDRSVEPLITALSDSDLGVRVAAAGALGDVGQVRAAVSLVTALRRASDDWFKGSLAAALRRIGAGAADAVSAALEDPDFDVRRRSAEILQEAGTPKADQVLVGTFHRGDAAVACGAYRFFINAGEPGTEPQLTAALAKCGHGGMAEAFVNSGNGELAKAARVWATKNGVTFIMLPGNDTGRRWGSKR